MERTKELKRSDIEQIRSQFVVCSHCGKAKEVKHFAVGAKVCEPCVRKALEKEGFAYAKRTWAEV